MKRESESRDAAEAKPDRRRDRIQLFAFFVALLGLVVGVRLAVEFAHPLPVAVSFTRVGGATRVETAAYAARFWTTRPRRAIQVAATADAPTMLHAAKCAVAHDAPLLFI